MYRQIAVCSLVVGTFVLSTFTPAGSVARGDVILKVTLSSSETSVVENHTKGYFTIDITNLSTNSQPTIVKLASVLIDINRTFNEGDKEDRVFYGGLTAYVSSKTTATSDGSENGGKPAGYELGIPGSKTTFLEIIQPWETSGPDTDANSGTQHYFAKVTVTTTEKPFVSDDVIITVTDAPIPPPAPPSDPTYPKAVPEPSSFALFGFGGLGLAIAARRRNRGRPVSTSQ